MQQTVLFLMSSGFTFLPKIAGGELESFRESEEKRTVFGSVEGLSM